MSAAPEPPDHAIGHILGHFSAEKLNRDQACRQLGVVFGRGDASLTRHLGMVLDDVHGHRITSDEARRDLARACAAAHKGDPHFLVFLAPEHV